MSKNEMNQTSHQVFTVNTALWGVVHCQKEGWGGRSQTAVKVTVEESMTH